MSDLHALIAERLERREIERKLEAIDAARRKIEAYEQVQRNYVQLQEQRTARAEREFERRMAVVAFMLELEPGQVFKAMIDPEAGRELAARLRLEYQRAGGE